MVATVARKGFAATTVADLVELSGVSPLFLRFLR
jgi:AcrR family transcriptional regulator